MRRSVLAVLGIFVVYRFLAHVPVPLAEPSQLKQLIEGVLSGQQGLGFLNMLSGGALASFSIVLLGLGPYINASIIMQILSKAIPSLEQKQKDGEHARRRINQYTRILTLPLAIGQSIGIITLLRQQTAASNLGIDITQNAGAGQWAVMVMALVAGSMLLMWLGEIITEKGIGNGISLVIFAGVASSLPSMVASLWTTIKGDVADHVELLGRTMPFSADGLALAGGIILAIIALTYWVVKLNESDRKVTIHYAKRVSGSREYGGITSVIPVKIIAAGVMPIIFAFSILSGLQFIGSLLKNVSSESLSKLGENLSTWFSSSSNLGGVASATGTSDVYIITYFALIFIFTYFYTMFIFEPKDIAEQLQQQGGFIEGVKPGEETAKYIGGIRSKLNLTGALSVGIIAVIPLISERYINSSALSLGGTSLIITVSVALETIRQMRSKALMYSYDDYNQELEASFNSSAGEDDTARPKGLKRLNIRLAKRPSLPFKNNSKRSVINNKAKKKTLTGQKGLQKKSK